MKQNELKRAHGVIHSSIIFLKPHTTPIEYMSCFFFLLDTAKAAFFVLLKVNRIIKQCVFNEAQQANADAIFF